MKTHRVALATLVASVFIAGPAHAQPSPPPNDNYLSSTVITEAATTGSPTPSTRRGGHDFGYDPV